MTAAPSDPATPRAAGAPATPRGAAGLLPPQSRGSERPCTRGERAHQAQAPHLRSEAGNIIFGGSTWASGQRHSPIVGASSARASVQDKPTPIFGNEPPLRPTVGNRAHLSRAHRHTASTAEHVIFGHKLDDESDAAGKPLYESMAKESCKPLTPRAAGMPTPRVPPESPIFGKPPPNRPTVGDRAHLSRAYRHTMSSADMHICGPPAPVSAPPAASSEESRTLLGAAGSALCRGSAADGNVGASWPASAVGLPPPPPPGSAGMPAVLPSAPAVYDPLYLAKPSGASEQPGTRAPCFLDDVLERVGRHAPGAPQAQVHLLGVRYTDSLAGVAVGATDPTAGYAGLPAQGTGTLSQPQGTVHAEIFDDSVTHRGARLVNGSAYEIYRNAHAIDSVAVNVFNAPAPQPIEGAVRTADQLCTHPCFAGAAGIASDTVLAQSHPQLPGCNGIPHRRPGQTVGMLGEVLRGDTRALPDRLGAIFPWELAPPAAAAPGKPAPAADYAASNAAPAERARFRGKAKVTEVSGSNWRESFPTEEGGILTQAGFPEEAPRRWHDKLFENRLKGVLASDRGRMQPPARALKGVPVGRLRTAQTSAVGSSSARLPRSADASLRAAYASSSHRG